MRDILIHQYFGVNVGSIWQYAKLDLRVLKQEVARLLATVHD